MRRLVRRFLYAGLVLIVLALPQLAVVTGRFAAWTEWAALMAMFFGVGTVIVATVFLLVIFPRLQAGTTQMTEVAAAVADGDLRRGLREEVVGGFHRQWRIFERMLESLRRLAGNLRAAAAENRRTAALLEAGAAGAREAAARVSAGTVQVRQNADAMASAIRDLTADGQRLVHLAAGLRGGADDGAQRNARVREAASAARGQLDEAGRLVAGLDADVRDSTAAIEALAAAAEEIQAFTLLVQQIARQSRLLSLNAAMEAARAGEYGDGFAVVASEVRRLAQSAAEAADRTETLVRAIVQRVADSREKGSRVAATLGAVTAATATGVGTFGTLVLEAEASDRWASSIADTAQQTDQLARMLDRRLAEVAAGLDTLARISAEVGTTGVSQQRAADAQSAVAGRLAERAAALAAIAAEFRLPGDDDPDNPEAPRGLPTPPVTGSTGLRAASAPPPPTSSAASPRPLPA